MYFNKPITIIVKNKSSIVNGWESKRTKFDKMILAINKSKRVVRMDHFVSNTMSWQSGMAFIKEKIAETVDSS